MSYRLSNTTTACMHAMIPIPLNACTKFESVVLSHCIHVPSSPHCMHICMCTKFKTELHHCMHVPSSKLLNSAEPHLCMHPVQNFFMPIPSSRLSNLTTTCPHPAQGCQTPPLHAHPSCMPTFSSRLSNPTSACPHPVQGCRTPPLHAHTQFKTAKLHLHAHTLLQ